LEIHGNEELAAYVRENTKLKVEYDGKGLISIPISQKHDALAALTTVEESGLEWRDLYTRRDSLDDVFVKLVSGRIDEKGEIKVEYSGDNSDDQQRR
jgi:hypothetical protein